MFAQEKENQQLLHSIITQGADPNRKSLGNILLIGRPGSGKSSLLQSIFTSLTRKDNPSFRIGKGVDRSITCSLDYAEKCRIHLYDIKDHPDSTTISKVVQYMPNFTDFAGLENVNDDNFKKILQAIIYGYIEPGTTMDRIHNFQVKYGAKKFNTMFNGPHNDWKITQIVFVQSHDVVIPENLIACLKEAVTETDPWGNGRKFHGRIICVITKLDTFQPLTIDQDEMEQKGYADKSPASGIEARLAALFNIEGDMDRHLIWVTNYSQATGFDYRPEIANGHFKLLKLLTQRAYDDEAYEGNHTMRISGLNVLKRFCPFPSITFVMFSVAVVVVSVVIINVFSKLSAEPPYRNNHRY